jgi:hypothetical protein
VKDASGDVSTTTYPGTLTLAVAPQPALTVTPQPGPGAQAPVQSAQGTLTVTGWGYQYTSPEVRLVQANGTILVETDPYYLQSVSIGGSSYSWKYSTAGGVQTGSIEDGQGGAVTFTHDARGEVTGRSVATSSAEGVVTTVHHDLSGRVTGSSVVSSTSADGISIATTRNYDAAGIFSGSSVQRSDGQGGAVTATYTSTGEVVSYKVSVATAANQVTTTTYDAHDVAVSVQVGRVFADGTAQTDYYDAAGHLTSSIVAKSTAAGGVQVGYYDPSQALTRYATLGIDASGNRTVTTFSGQGAKLASDTLSANGVHTGVTYAADGSSITTTTALDHSYTVVARSGAGDVVTTQYSSAGIKLSDTWTHPDGSHGSHTFAADGSSTGVGFYTDGSTASFTSDGDGFQSATFRAANGVVVGSLTSLDDGFGNVIVTYFDARGRATGDSWQLADGSHGRTTFNANGTLSGVRVDASGEAVTYNNASREVSVSQLLADQSVNENAELMFTVPGATFFEADPGDLLVYRAAMADGSSLPTWLSFDTRTASFSATPPMGAAGVFDIEVTATNGHGFSASDVFALSVVHVNAAPLAVFSVPDQQCVEGASWTYTLPEGAFLDPDPDDVLTYTAGMADATPLPPWMHFDPAGRSLEGTPPAGAAGAFFLRVVATDELGASANENFILTVTAPIAQDPPQEPPTEQPPTEQPPTEQPPTEVPPTEVPPTEVPPAEVPPTEQPPTEVPPTEQPPTEVPPTEQPPTEVPPTEQPPTDPPTDTDPPRTVQDITGTSSRDVLIGTDIDDNLQGYAGRDVLQGLTGNDTLSGGAGADRLYGGEGADVYVFALGDGRDRISDFDAIPGVQDALQFGPGITGNDLSLRKAGNHLVISIAGTQDQVRISKWFQGTAHHIEIIRFDDGTEILDTELQDLVDIVGSWRPALVAQAH